MIKARQINHNNIKMKIEQYKMDNIFTKYTKQMKNCRLLV